MEVDGAKASMVVQTDAILAKLRGSEALFELS